MRRVCCTVRGRRCRGCRRCRGRWSCRGRDFLRADFLKRRSEQTREDENCNERKANKPVHGNPLRTFERHCKFQFRKTKPPPKTLAAIEVTPLMHATKSCHPGAPRFCCRASIALNAGGADRRRSSPLERPCEFLAEFLEPRVAPVRSAGSPIAGLELRQKIVHRCNETKTFYVSTRSQKCLERRRGARRPAGRFVASSRLTVSHTPVRNGIEHFVVGGKWEGVEDAGVYIWIGRREEIWRLRSGSFVLIKLAVGEKPAVWKATAATGWRGSGAQRGEFRFGINGVHPPGLFCEECGKH